MVSKLLIEQKALGMVAVRNCSRVCLGLGLSSHARSALGWVFFIWYAAYTQGFSPTWGAGPGCLGSTGLCGQNKKPGAPGWDFCKSERMLTA